MRSVSDAHHLGQATLEHILAITAVIAVIIVFLGPNGPFRESVNNAVNTSIDELSTVAGQLSTRGVDLSKEEP